MSSRYFYQDLTNPITGQKLRITATDKFVLSNKVQRQYARWERERTSLLKAEKRQQAIDKTIEVQGDIRSLLGILSSTLEVNDRINWLELLDKRPFTEPEPERAQYSNASISKSLSFIGAFKKRAVEQQAEEDRAFEFAKSEFDKKKSDWELEQKKFNSSLAHKKLDYEKGAEKGVEDYISMVFDRSEYPDVITLNFEVYYNPVSQMMLVELDLPAKEILPDATEYKYVASKDTVEPKLMRAKEFASFYDGVQYRIVLRVIHEVFEADYRNHITSVVLNGNAIITDPATGKSGNKSILTIQVQRGEFVDIDLSRVDPAACFRHFKGVTNGNLADLRAVKPIMKINREDKRIIEANNVLDEFDPSQNLATMEWEKFEVLIRDLFRKEFSGNGTTVEVTRASRDAGVDGIAFDEDPIRGGKFVIQAKRYNNLVPVSAVRDLYGTVMNEGAVKGILVTTSYYGPDAIAFAKDKPLTLINGEELLYMFQKHGRDFKIQLQKDRRASSNLH